MAKLCLLTTQAVSYLSEACTVRRWATSQTAANQRSWLPLKITIEDGEKQNHHGHPSLMGELSLKESSVVPTLKIPNLMG